MFAENSTPSRSLYSGTVTLHTSYWPPGSFIPRHWPNDVTRLGKTSLGRRSHHKLSWTQKCFQYCSGVKFPIFYWCKTVVLFEWSGKITGLFCAIVLRCKRHLSSTVGRAGKSLDEHVTQSRDLGEWPRGPLPIVSPSPLRQVPSAAVWRRCLCRRRHRHHLPTLTVRRRRPRGRKRRRRPGTRRPLVCASPSPSRRRASFAILSAGFGTTPAGHRRKHVSIQMCIGRTLREGMSIRLCNFPKAIKRFHSKFRNQGNSRKAKSYTEHFNSSTHLALCRGRNVV